MKNELSQQERGLFLRLKGGNSKIKIVIIAVLVFILFGLLIDGFSGFYILKNAKSWVWGIVGLIVLAIFSLIGEAGAEWLNSKDNVSHPLYKRAFYLLLLLIYAGIIMALAFLVFRYLGW